MGEDVAMLREVGKSESRGDSEVTAHRAHLREQPAHTQFIS